MITGTRSRLTAEIARQQKLSEAIARAQIDISSGTRIQSASDDPAGAARVSQIRRAQQNETVWSSNAETAESLANQADTALESLVTAATRAVELMTLAASGTASAEDREAYAIELAGIADEVRTLMAQTDSQGQSVFPTGDPLRIPIGSGLTLSATLSADIVFGTGTDDLATIIDDAIAALGESDDTLRAAAVASASERLQAGNDRAIAARARQGALMGIIETTSERLANSSLALTDERSSIEDTDLTETIARMNAQMLTLEAAQAAFAKINSKTLFDLLG